MSPVTRPIPTMVTIRTFLRPILSPRAPKMKPPMGRATKPTARVAKELIADTKGSWDTKYCALNTRAAAVVNRKKSYHSSAVPTRAARATFLATLSSTAPGGCGLGMVVALLALLAIVSPKNAEGMEPAHRAEKV